MDGQLAVHGIDLVKRDQLRGHRRRIGASPKGVPEIEASDWFDRAVDPRHGCISRGGRIRGGRTRGVVQRRVVTPRQRPSQYSWGTLVLPLRMAGMQWSRDSILMVCTISVSALSRVNMARNPAMISPPFIVRAAESMRSTHALRARP